MPIYEYKCSVCATVFEEIRKMADRDGSAVCKMCGATSRHILSSFSVLNSSPKEHSARSKDHSSGSGGIQIKDCMFENANVGISVPKGTKIDMKGNRFKNVKKTVEFRDE